MKNSCQLLGPVSITIQVFLGAIAVSTLLIKRNCEHPRRKLIVWIYDVGKQIVGSLGIHFLNLALSVYKKKRKGSLIHLLLSKKDPDEGSDQCDWYFLNLLMDTTVGIPILWFSFTLLESICVNLKIQNVESGNYFTSSKQQKRPLFTAFLKQLLVFTTALAMMKLCIFVILNYFEEVASWFANLVLGWSDQWPTLQVFLVMFVSPIVLNCFQFFCVDNIVKLPTDHLNFQNANNFESISNSDYPSGSNNNITSTDIETTGLTSKSSQNASTTYKAI